jgi:hypothetical protein
MFYHLEGGFPFLPSLLQKPIVSFESPGTLRSIPVRVWAYNCCLSSTLNALGALRSWCVAFLLRSLHAATR